MIYGNFGKLLRVNLENKQISIEDIGEKILNDTVGGKGLATYYLLKEIDPKVDPLSPHNKIIFVTGPACDTGVAASSRYGVFSKSPLTGIYVESYSGGHVAPIMKRTGFDLIILEGESPIPVYLHINESGVTFCAADNLWGLETYEAEDRILKETGTREAQALVIGPAGENLVKFACIKNNYWRSAGRGGLGAVMGSKKVKGIVFSGKARAPLANPKLLKDYKQKLWDEGKDNSIVKAYYQYGTPMVVALTNEVNAFPTRYWHEGTSQNWRQLSAEYMKDNLKVRSRACKGCFLACGKLIEVVDGKRKGLKIEGPEYETIYAFGGLCCLKQIEEVAYLNDICDRLGMDTISGGNLVSLSIEAGIEGKIQGAPSYGDTDAIAELLKNISKRHGLGNVLAEGIRIASKEIGMEDKAIHVKGMEPAGFDPRILKGMGLGYATSDRGACHLRATFYKAELSGIIPPDQIEGKAELFIDYEDRMTLFDSLIYCRFYRDLVTWEDLSTIIAATTGQELSINQLRDLVNKTVARARIFNNSVGMTRKDDTLPPRFFSEALDKEGEQIIKKEELDYMLSDYYRLRNWDSEGLPRESILTREL